MTASDATPAPSALPKRFYTTVTVETVEGGFRPTLDGKPIRTPARAVLVLPSRELADAVAAEWRAQQDVIRPATMPLTRLVNSCIDGVAGRMQEVVDDIVQFAGSDLLCYRAEGPEGLVADQNSHWNPILAWAEKRARGRFVLSEGVMPVRQPEATLAGIRRMVPIHDPLRLGALHSLTTLTGSALIALAVAEGRLAFEAGWRAAHVDEDWNIRLWGEDSIAAERRARRRAEAEAAVLVLHGHDRADA